MKFKDKSFRLSTPIFFISLAASIYFNYVIQSNDLTDNYQGFASQDRESHDLAFKQSFGFFDDISDSNWRRFYQQPANEAQFYKNVTYPDHRANTPAWWIFFNWDPYFSCKHLRKVGGLGDAGKWICDPERIRQRSRGDCLIYSIGSFGNYQFEDGLHDLLNFDRPACEIHIFDPGNYDRHQNSEKGMHYHKFGLKSSYTDEYKAVANLNRQTGNFKSFHEIRRELGHADRPINILKLDCVGCEWHTYKDWIDADIRQLVVVTYDLPEFPSQFFDGLLERGFVLYAKEVDSFYRKGKAAAWSFMRLRPEFFHSAI